MKPQFENRYRTQVFRTATHIYLHPHPLLRPLIAHYTLCPEHGGYTAPAPGNLTLVPDGSGCFVLTLGRDRLDARVYGPSTRAVTLTADGGPCPPRLFVEFTPGGLYAFTGIPQAELSDRVWPLAELVPGLFALLDECSRSAGDLDELVQRADRLLCAWPQTSAPVGPMLNWLRACRASDPVRALAEETGYSPRHLSRLFTTGAGLGCKTFLRVLRVNAAAKQITHTPSLTVLAYELGYFDQAHFIHDFQAVCGVSPGAYRRSLSDFYNEPLKF